jgi:hypothetical protein
MISSMTTILQCLTGEWAAPRHPEAILTACAKVGYTAWHDRLLTPITALQLFLLQMLHGHTACSHLPHLSGLRFSAAAYCQARAARPHRVEPCVKKRRPKSFPFMIKPRQELRQQLVQQELRG